MPSSPNSILKAIRQLINKNTLENANQLASLAGLTLEDPNKKIEVIEHTTKKGKVIKGIVRTDLSYAEAKAIDEYTFKKDGGWFIREKHLGLELPSVNSQQATTDTPQNEPETVLQSDTLVNDEDNNIKGLERKFKPAAKKYKNPEIKLDTKEGVKLLKKTLTKLFPDTKFSVTMARGTAYGSAYVSWVDGASYNLVGTIAQHFRGSGFDGMTDSSHSLYALNEDGKVVDYGLGFISFSRSYSREFLEKLQSSFPDMLQNMIKQEGVTIKGDGFNAYFDAKESWTRDKINDAKTSHSTSKYNFGVVPQAENKADIEPSNEQPKSGQVQNSHQELADTLKMLGWKIEPLNNQEGDVFASKDMEVKYKDKLIKAKATLRKWLENKSLLTAYADELVLKNDHKATIDTSQFWKLSPVEQKQIIIDLETALRSFLIANRERFSQADSQSPQVVTTQEPQPKTNQMPSLMQDATGLDPAIKDMVKEYYDLVNGTYVDEKLADPTLENWERKEYQQVKDGNIKRKDELAKHLNNVVSANGIDWKTYYNELVQTNKQEVNNVPSTSNALESDIKPTSTPDSQQGIKNSNDDESAKLGRMARPPVNGLDARGGSERDSSTSLSENDGIGIGARGDTSVSTGAGERGVGASNTASKSSRSSRTNEPRTPNERSRDSAVVRTSTRTGSVTQNAKEAAQLKAEGTPTQWGDTANIDKALPYLLPEQRDDVAKLEKRLIEDNKNGMLFTNGTGTGKTFTGLGAVKRFANAGKKNILIVSMNDKIIRDFVKSALSLNLDIHHLDGVTDNGKDKIVATTYANLAQNLTLGKRDWDLIVVDEAHNLMQGEKGENTNALAKLRALSGHHAGFHEWVKMRHADKDPKPIGENPETGNPIYNQDEVSAWEQFKKPLREQWQKTWAEQPKGRTKVIFLTATPFSYVKTLDWAEGYLFDFVPPAKKFSNDTEAMGAAYNSGSEYERFYMDNFGYKMRYNRLTRPDGRVDVGILERKFAEKLKTEGAMSGRDLSVPFDYDRKFVLVNSEIGKKIDKGFKFLWDTKDKDGKSKYSDLLRVLNKRFDYLARLQLLEAIKAQEAIEQIKKHIALGRKVIVFHDYNEGGGSNPFVYVGGATQNDVGAVESQYEDFKRARPDLIALDLDLDAPITTIKKAFPDALLYNGRVAKGQRSKNADLFNTDSNGHNVLIAQSDAGATGISFHDTTGTHQRVIINIGMPSKPAKLRQTEGRIYRVGQASNAIQRYLTTGTDWERSTFSQKIAERAETVDNLAQGESAVVSIKDALVQAYEEAEYFEPSENDGIGGKAYDEENARINKLTPFERAKTDYWVKQKVTAKRQDREGKEWYATPEPVGLFMVNLSGAHSGDDILEPSAGDGAIGRYMPSDASVTFIEPSESLASRARMNNTNANVIIDSFENHNSGNKYDAIVMNPPFGQGGSIAIKHLVKAFGHLRIGGRVVALLPSGNMDNLIVDYSNKGYFAGIYQVAEFALPSSTFKNAGTAVNTKIYVFEKHENKSDVTTGFVSKNLSHYDDIEDLFDAIENINIKPRKPRIDEALAEYGLEIYPDRSKYIVSGEGLKRKDITKTLFGVFVEKNKDGDVVEKYNRSTIFLKWLKDSQIPTMAQFNNGLSFNNLPIKYQQNTNKYNTWDGVGGMPDWLSTAINRYGAKLENFAVEKPVYDSVTNNDPKEIIAAIRKLMANNTPENARALAREAGLRIAQPQNSASVIIDADKLKAGEISVNDFISANGLDPDNYDFMYVGETQEKTKYQVLINEMLGVVEKHIANAESKFANTPEQRKQKAKTLSTWRGASDAIKLIAKNYENPFLTTLAARRNIPASLKTSFEKKFSSLSDSEKYMQWEEQAKLSSIHRANKAIEWVLKENKKTMSLPSDVAASYGQNNMFVQTRGQQVEKPKNYDDFDVGTKDFLAAENFHKIAESFSDNDDRIGGIRFKVKYNKRHKDHNLKNISPIGYKVIKAMLKSAQSLIGLSSVDIKVYIEAPLFMEGAVGSADNYFVGRDNKRMASISINSKYLANAISGSDESRGQLASLADTIAHELWHIRQSYDKKLISSTIGEWTWLGKEYRRIKYENRPWEIEARKVGKALSPKIIDDLVGQNLISISDAGYIKKAILNSNYIDYADDESAKYDDIGFNFTPAIDFDQTLKAIRKLMANNTPENARALADVAGLRIKPTIKAAKNYSDKDVEKTIKKWQELKTVGRSIIIQRLDAGWYVEKKKTGVASKYEFTNGEQYLVNSKKNGTNNVYDFIYFAMNTFGDLKTALDVSGVLNRLPQEEAANLIAKLKELRKQGKISESDYSWSTLVINDAVARDGDPYTVKTVETIKNQFISPLSAPVAPVITQSTAQASETLGEQADENIAQVQNSSSGEKSAKKYKSGTREWQKFCRDASVEYARLYQSYMNDKTDYDSFIKKKELSPLGKVSIKNIERVVSRNFYKWREIDIVQFDLKPEYLENNRFDDIGGFNFEPMVSVDATMQAIKKLMAENTLDNARYLAMIAGLKLKEDDPSQDLDMFGEPINQDFDLFGDPIQDGEESPVEELPRLAVVELPLNKLKLSEDVPQFKSGADGESGVVEALGGKFDRTGVAPIQVWERADGRLEIISGRHRTDLARRSGEKTIPAQVHKESEGFTAKQAMMLDAELNIRDGQGKVKDYVDYFTHSEISEDEAERRGLIARSIGQRAFTIASKGSEELKTLHRNEIISDQAAAEISNLAPSNSAMQAVGLRVLQEHKPLNNALNTIRAVMALTREKGQEPDTFDLFGFDDSALKEAEAMARIASRKQRQIAEQLNAIKGAVKNPKLAAKHGVMVENEADALTKVQTMTAQKARWDNWSSHADLLAEVRAELNDKFDSLLDDEDDYYWLCQEELAL